jgi:sortase (surface protein transpeptidase)
VSAPARAGRRLATLLGLAALLVGVALLAATIGAFVVSRCGDGGEAQVGRLALQLDAEADRPRLAATPPPRSDRRAAVPVRIEIPRIGVRAPVIRLGLNRDKSLEVPKDFGDAGWWSGGPRPGERGPAVIAGHVDSYTGPAVFYRLTDLRPNDVIVVVGRDGTRKRFSVVGSERYAKAQFPTDRVYGATDRPTLRLITCGGDFDSSTGHYLDNTVVYARAA